MEKDMTNRQNAALQTKRKLIAAALELIKSNGFNAINVEDITREAGVAKGTFYTYFKRKEDIVLEISRAPFAEIADELEAMRALPLIDKLSHYVRRFMQCVQFCGIHICRQWTRDVLDPNEVPENKDAQKWQYDVNMLQNILKNAVQNGELKKNTPIDLFTHILICQMYGMMTCWCMSDGKFDPLDWTDRFCAAQLPALFGPYLSVKK